jgi:hypothetical protein
VAKFQAIIHEVLVSIADKVEAATDWDCDAGVRHAIAAGLRGDDALRRDT